MTLYDIINATRANRGADNISNRVSLSGKASPDERVYPPKLRFFLSETELGAGFKRSATVIERWSTIRIKVRYWRCVYTVIFFGG